MPATSKNGWEHYYLEVNALKQPMEVREGSGSYDKKGRAMKKPTVKSGKLDARHQSIFGDVTRIIDAARQSAARSVNAVMTAAYWLIGRYLVEFEQEGKKRAGYGEETVEQLAAELSARYGRGYSLRNLWQMKAFYLAWPIPQTPSAELEGGGNLQTLSADFR